MPRITPACRDAVNGSLSRSPDHPNCPLWTQHPDKKPSPSTSPGLDDGFLSYLHEMGEAPPTTCSNARSKDETKFEMSILWTIIIGFIAGVIAKFIMPGDNEPTGFILTTILGIVGAFVASYLGEALGWYQPGEGAGLIGAVVGAIIVLFVYGLFAGRQRRA